MKIQILKVSALPQMYKGDLCCFYILDSYFGVENSQNRLFISSGSGWSSGAEFHFMSFTHFLFTLLKVLMIIIILYKLN